MIFSAAIAELAEKPAAITAATVVIFKNLLGIT
jgi:hypothetical protein